MQKIKLPGVRDYILKLVENGYCTKPIEIKSRVLTKYNILENIDEEMKSLEKAGQIELTDEGYVITNSKK
jgi:hypothetical protein